MKGIITLRCMSVACMYTDAALYAQPTAYARINQTVLLNNQVNTVPLRDLDERHTALITRLDGTLSAAFGDQLSRYAPIDRFVIPVQPDNYLHLDEDIKFYNTIIAALTAKDLSDAWLMQFIATQAIGKAIILAVFGDGTNLKALDFRYFPILWTPEKNEAAAADAAMSLLDRKSTRLNSSH